MTTYYKATRMDGTDFKTGKINYTRQPLPEMSGEGEFPGAGWLHLATTPTECVMASWPCRLFEIEPAKGATIFKSAEHPNKIGVSKANVIREIDSSLFFGPQGFAIVALIERAKKLNREDIEKLYAAWDAAGYAARCAARDAAWDAAGYAADAAGYAAGYAACALVSRDLIGKGKFTQEQYDVLTIPWRQVIGKIHPDDEDLQKPNLDTEINKVQSALDDLKLAIKKL